MDFVFLPKSQQTPGEDAAKPRKPYHRPVLESLGDLRTMTLGSSPTGDFDSGGGSLYEYAGDKLIPDFPHLPGEYPQPGDPTEPSL